MGKKNSNLRRRKGAQPAKEVPPVVEEEAEGVGAPVSEDDGPVEEETILYSEEEEEGGEEDYLSEDDGDSDAPDLPLPEDAFKESDDTALFASALVGFLFFMVFGSILPKLDVDQSHVMAGGLISLMVLIVVVNFCPSCCRRRLIPGIENDDIPPTLVFLIAGCLGTMIGGMFGGVLKHVT